MDIGRKLEENGMKEEDKHRNEEMRKRNKKRSKAGYEFGEESLKPIGLLI